jgi:GR25 family glycosyltransferase involved in LPS biosynthesis
MLNKLVVVMRIGITNLFKGSAFGGAMPQVALYLALALKEAGHDACFLTPFESEDWFIDCASAATIPRVKMEQGIRLEMFDIVIEVVWYLPSELRQRVAKKVIMFYHYPSAFYDIESSVYPLASQARNFDGIYAIWTWAHFKTSDHEYLEFVSRKPVFKCPFFWNPILLDSYIQEASVPEWKKEINPSIVICESNETNTSNCTLPMVILSEIYKNNKSIKWTVLNSENLSKRDFFINNIIKNLHIESTPDISGNFMKRVRLPDIRRGSNYIISHQRFRPIKYMLLDALYLGIPLIHNCDMLKDVIGGSYHYTLNRIGLALEAWSNIIKDERPALDLVRADLLKKWGPAVGVDAVNDLITMTNSWVQPVIPIKSRLRVAFFDMWADFQPQYNLFLETFKQNGFDVECDQIDPTFIIFGPFGKDNQNAKWTNIPKIFYTGENIPAVIRNDIVLNIGFSRSISDNYIRVPNWFLELNWYNQDSSLIKNPLPFSLDLLKSTADIRSKFCIFVASNPTSVCRNTLYNVLCRYKDVDSAGLLFNNSSHIQSGPGGTGGQVIKVEAYRKYKFALVCENSQSNGYITEKLLHAKLAGCVPIYWGAQDVTLDFNKEAFINVSDYTSFDDLLQAIENLDKDTGAWLNIATKPLLLDLEKPRAILSLMAQSIISKVSNKSESSKPTESEPKTINKTAIPPYGMTQINDVAPQVIVTCCNGKFVESAILLIKSSKVPVYVWVWDIDFMDAKKLTKAGAKMIIPLDTKWNPNWADFWNPLHFAWKPLVMILAYNTLPAGTNVLYLDAGIEVIGDLDTIWANISRDQLFTCYMKEHKMVTWCHPSFCNILVLTPEELEAPQLSANIVGFISGGSAGIILNQTLAHACNPDIIVGHKWHKYSDVCMGHRHDQSILTLMCLRAGVKPHLLDIFAGYKSYEDTLQGGAVLYVHRGKYIRTLSDTNTRTLSDSDTRAMSILKDIAETYIVNLEHRKDRLDTFWQNHPYMISRCQVIKAVNGREIVLNNDICHIFRNNDFKWKKSVMGCALSHYAIWKQIVNGPDGNFLVLEDDAQLVNDFVTKWSSIADLMPRDSDIVFLGGVLPPNKPALPMITEPVNRAFAAVKKNSLFGSDRRYFHFCTYSYIITKTGAQKLCQIIDKMGIYTSADHMLVNNMDGPLNIYFTTPLLGGCIQDNDPIYQNAEFNNYNRVDKFDSEIWNNTECFSAEEVASVTKLPTVTKYLPLTVVYFEKDQFKQCIESEWLREIFKREFVWSEYSEPVRSGSQVLLYYQHTTPASTIIGWINRNIDCAIYLFHASDEARIADVSLYSHPAVRCVFRNYWRPDCIRANVVHLPLGYLNGKGGNGTIQVASHRPLTWTFAGAADRNNRVEIIKNLVKRFPKNYVHLTPTWGTDKNMPADKYVGMLQDSQYIPCLDGFYNTESYRFYEALEQGAIPVVCKDKQMSYENILCGGPLLLLDDWSTDFTEGVNVDEKQKELVYWWSSFKAGLSKLVADKMQ